MWLILYFIVFIFCVTNINTSINDNDNVNKVIVIQRAYRPLPVDQYQDDRGRYKNTENQYQEDRVRNKNTENQYQDDRVRNKNTENRYQDDRVRNKNTENRYQDDRVRNKNNKQSRLIQNILPKAKGYVKTKEKTVLREKESPEINNDRFVIDPVLNSIQRRFVSRKRGSSSETSDSDDESSSLEMTNWKEEWQDHWKMKKYEAANSTSFRGDIVNMVAARPWGAACGDPNQHDMPWGTCMLSQECEAEYRIYRGDLFCGRTRFVCCALQLTTYDMYQGDDVSFADSELSTDSEEKRNRGKGSSENKKKGSRKRSQKRRKEREKRKKTIKKNIQKIVKEIRKILDRSYRNGTKSRRKKTKQLKRFVKNLKKKYKQDRQAVKDVHEIELIKIDNALMKRINDIREMNQNFIKNATFRDIVVNGTVNKQGARMLIQAYPELTHYFGDITRRRADGGPTDYLDYDVEYGMLYY